jgi:hypothetical protein
MRLFENRVLRRIFGPKKDEVTGEWRKLHSEELNNLYSSSHIIRQDKSRRMMWTGHVVRTGEERKLVKVLVGKPERHNPTYTTGMKLPYQEEKDIHSKIANIYKY